MVEVLQVDPATVPTIVASQRLGLCPQLDEIVFPQLHPSEVKIDGWRLPDTMMPIDFGLPRIIKSTFRHLYIRFLKEPISAYGYK